MMDVPDMADMEKPDIPDIEVPDVSEFRLSMEEKLSKGKVLGASDGSLKEKKMESFNQKEIFSVQIMAQCISFFFLFIFQTTKFNL